LLLPAHRRPELPGLSREEHPYALQLARELSQLIRPISFSAP
jgi:hypothetical protein